MSTKKFDEFIKEYAYFDDEGKVKWTDPNIDKEKRKKELLKNIVDAIVKAHKEDIPMEEIFYFLEDIDFSFVDVK